MGHKYYGVKRRQLLIDSVMNKYNAIYNTNTYDNYTLKITSLIKDGDVTHFSKEMVLKPKLSDVVVVVVDIGFLTRRGCNAMIVFV